VNVLFLTHNFPRFDGDASGSFLLLLARALRAEGVTVSVVAPASADAAAAETVSDIPVERFRYAPRRYETLAYGGNMAQLVKASWGAKLTLLGFLGAEFRMGNRKRADFAPDVIHAHWWFPSGMVGTWLARLTGKPLVTTMHGTDVRLAKTVAFARPAFRHVLQHSAAVTAVSRWLSSEAGSLVSAPTAQIAPMPVNTAYFTPDGARDSRRLLFVGRLSSQKGLEYLLRALALMTTPAGLDIAGAGEELERLQGLAQQLGLGDRIRWLGVLPHRELAQLYRSAAAVVVPSLDEGLGLVAVEAQLCETPVVAADSGGLPDVVQHDRTGILVPPADAARLARALDDLLARPDAGASLGRAGRLHALATFAPESVARRYAEIYRNAIASSPA
jgi:glycosyltransferase involved in cell wall biosynthesis